VGDIDPQKYFPAKTIKEKKEQKKVEAPIT